MAIAVFAVAIGLFALFGPGGWMGGSDEQGGGGVDTADTALVAQGRAVYADHCASCHGVKLEGQPDWRTRNPDGTMKAPPHDETGHTWHHPDRDMFNYTKNGGQATAPPGFKSAMPGFAEALGDRDIWAVLSYIHSTWPAKVVERQQRINGQSRR